MQSYTSFVSILAMNEGWKKEDNKFVYCSSLVYLVSSQMNIFGFLFLLHIRSIYYYDFFLQPTIGLHSEDKKKQ